MKRAAETPITDAINAKMRPYFTHFESDALIYFDSLMDDFQRLEREKIALERRLRKRNKENTTP